MLKPKKGFLMAQLNIEKFTPLQWDGIMRAMDAYAEHYHEEQSKLHQPTVIDRFCKECGNAKMLQGNGIIEPLCACNTESKT